MRYAVLSDVHANLEALRAVLQDCRGEVDGVLNLGDIVGYGADPEATLDRLAEVAGPTVAGNHDFAVAGRLDLDWFNPVARTAVEWTAARLSKSQRAYLGGLPLSAVVGDATLVHASPLRPEEWEYLITPDEGFAAFAGFDTRLCFVGHSHRAACWSIGSSGKTWAPGAFDVRLERGRRYLVNVGSVGQPRDGDPRACYAIWDTDARRVLLRRVRYAADEARRKILAARLPRLLADRLERGL